MTYRRGATISTTLACVTVSVVLAAQATMPSPPAGFTALFNGKDLSGWRGRPGGGGVFSPYVEAKFTPEERAAKQKEWNDDRDLHWRVDTGERRDRLRRQRRAPRDREAVRRLRAARRLAADAGGRRLGYLPSRLSAGAAVGSGESAGVEERRRQGIRRPLEQQPRQSRPLAARQGRQSHRRVEHARNQDGRDPRLGHAQRQTSRRRPGAR